MLADKLRKAVLQAAIQGKLTEQLETDGNAADLVAEIKKEKDRLIKEKKLKKQKPLPEITAEEIPFEIPDNWCWVRLNNICRYMQRGKSPKYSEIKIYPVVAQKCNQWNKFSLDLARFIEPKTIESYNEERFLLDDDILVNSTGLGTVGRVGQFKSDKQYKIVVADSHVTVIRPINKLVNKSFIKYFLSSPCIQDNIEKMCSGSTKQKELALSTLQNLLIPLPPINEQNRIVEKIEEVFVKIEQLKANEEKLALLQKNFPDKLKKSLLQAAIQGKLTEQLSTDDNVEDLLAEIRKEKEKLIKEKKIKKQKPLPPITEEEIPFEIPSNWRWVRLGEIGKIVGGGTPKTDVLEYWVNGNIPWITPADMKNIKGKYIYHGEKYITLLGLNKSSAQLMPKNSILFSSRAPIGYIAITKNEVSTNQGFKSIVPFNVSLTNYIYYALLALVDNIKKIGTGTTFKEVSGSVVEKIIIPLPPIAEQKRIVKQLDLLLNNVKKLKI